MVSIVPISGGADASRALQVSAQDAPSPSRGVDRHHGQGHHHHQHGGPPGGLRGRRHQHHHHHHHGRHRIGLGLGGMAAKRWRGELSHGGKGQFGSAHRAFWALRSLFDDNQQMQVRGRCGKHMRMFDDLAPHGHCRRRRHRSLSPHHLMHGRSGEGSPGIGRRGNGEGGDLRGGCCSHRRERHHHHHHGQELTLGPQSRPSPSQPTAIEQGIEQFGQLSLTAGSGL